MDKTKTIEPLIWLAILFAIGLAVYSTGLRIPYYADDYQFVFDLSPQWSFHTFFYQNVPENSFYRPLQASFLWIVQRYFGLNTLPVHLTQLVLHVLLSWLVFIFLLDLRFTRIQAALGSLFMLVSQANVHAVLSNDTLSQIGSTLFGYFSIWLMYHSRLNSQASPFDRGLGNKGYFLSILAMALSYLSKESGIAFFPMMVTVIVLFALQEGPSSAFYKVLRRSAPFVVLTIVYLLARSIIAAAQPAFGSDVYNFHIGANLFRNTVMFLLATSVPVSSVAIYIALKSGLSVAVFTIFAATIVFLLAVGFGLWLSRERYRTLLLCGAFFMTGLFPMVMLNHVSELYINNSMPIASALFGIGLGRCLEFSRKNRAVHFALIGFILLLFTSHIVAVESKALLMKKNGERSNVLLSQIQPFLRNVPAGGRLLLLNPCDNGIEYSIFMMKGFNVLENGFHRLNQLAGRNDFTIEIVDPCKTKQRVAEKSDLLLSLDDKVTRVEQTNINIVR